MTSFSPILSFEDWQKLDSIIERLLSDTEFSDGMGDHPLFEREMGPQMLDLFMTRGLMVTWMQTRTPDQLREILDAFIGGAVAMYDFEGEGLPSGYDPLEGFGENEEWRQIAKDLSAIRSNIKDFPW